MIEYNRCASRPEERHLTALQPTYFVRAHIDTMGEGDGGCSEKQFLPPICMTPLKLRLYVRNAARSLAKKIVQLYMENYSNE